MTLWRIRATVTDRPGFLSVLTASLALRGVNILTVQVHTTEAGAVDDFLVDAPAELTADDLVAAVEKGRGRDCWVARSEAQGLVDQPTRALGLATRLVHDPDALGETLRTLLAADSVTWRPLPAAGGPGYDRGAMRLPDPDGGTFEVGRSAPAFTPAEFARAQALLELAGAVLRRSVEHVTLVLPEGAEVLVRPALTEDLAAVQAMHQRCSADTLRRRYPTMADRPDGERLRRLLAPARGVTLLAVPEGGTGDPDRVVAMANLVAEGELAQVALLVEDAWQRRGLGGALLRRLATYADRGGYAALSAYTPADNVGMLRLLNRFHRPGAVERDGNLLSVTVPLAERSAAAPPAERLGTRLPIPAQPGPGAAAGSGRGLGTSAGPRPGPGVPAGRARAAAEAPET
ncbi:GNAT family N-acetyltransferase [Micromonospora sp. HM5-17]|uniref:GNAT family N-acetyltransferase n=1 Tax=Micromonospora sp. HM5-17 TaxID=2487710 RepID=UPI000F490CFA|nr:GNAT family N-acetyltransferase [Micromonospora sp. HM5-17]ROT32948.1 GNAT family N-acetyltransferase [Micromonospora sp. HM5-17]